MKRGTSSDDPNGAKSRCQAGLRTYRAKHFAKSGDVFGRNRRSEPPKPVARADPSGKAERIGIGKRGVGSDTGSPIAFCGLGGLQARRLTEGRFRPRKVARSWSIPKRTSLLNGQRFCLATARLIASGRCAPINVAPKADPSPAFIPVMTSGITPETSFDPSARNLTQSGNSSFAPLFFRMVGVPPLV